MNRCSEAACSRGREEDACRWHRAACFHRQGGTWTRHTPCDGVVRERNAGQSRADVPSAGGLGNGARPPETKTSRPPAIERPRRDREPRALPKAAAAGAGRAFRRGTAPLTWCSSAARLSRGPSSLARGSSAREKRALRRLRSASGAMERALRSITRCPRREAPGGRRGRRPPPPQLVTAQGKAEGANRLFGCVRGGAGRGKGKRRARRGPGGRLRY